jgi:hypothetical protein
MADKAKAAEILSSALDELDELDESISAHKNEIKEAKATQKTIRDRTRQDTGMPPGIQERLRVERRTDPEIRAQNEALLQVGRAWLGLLDGTPLGDSARRSYEKKPDAPDTDDEPPSTRVEDDRQTSIPDLPNIEIDTEPAEATLDEARAAGRQAAKNGVKVTENPYPGHQSKLRAAWDEGWCWENGSDGMEIPEELRRTKRKSKKDEDKDGGGE